MPSSTLQAAPDLLGHSFSFIFFALLVLLSNTAQTPCLPTEDFT
ncbi:hypothetical protein [Streptomyces sp. UG1]